MKLEKGLYTDCSEADQPGATYRFAKNIVENLTGTLENEDGFLEMGAVAPYTVIGIVPVRNDFVVFSTDDTDSEIGLVTRVGDTLNYTTVYNNPDLNFSTSAPIKGEYRKDVTNSRVVAWIDDINSPRIINIDDTSGINDITDLEVFPNITNPSLSSPVITDTGGALKTGALIPISRYKGLDGSTTNWFVHDFTFYINDDSKSLPFNENDGAEPETISNKSVQFVLEGCDTTFDTIVIGYIQIINNVITQYEVAELVNNTTVSVTITGNESVTDISLDEILTPTAVYDNAKAITQLAGRLYLANLTSPELPDLQAIALDIAIDYNLELTTVVQNTGNHKDVLPPTFMPGEVYAFYLGVELKKGGWAFYHIPGRPPVGTETNTVTNEGMTYKRFQVENTSNSGGYTNMGYWENEGENYPDDPTFVGAIAGDLRGLPVRHHRFPTAGYLVDTYYGGDAEVGITKLPNLLIQATNVNIPVEAQAQISRWKIFFAKKNLQDSLVLGSDLLHFDANPELDPDVQWSSGGNWETSFAGGADFNDIDKDALRGHSLDLVLQQGAVTPVYALFNYKLRRYNLNTIYDGFRSDGGLITACGSFAPLTGDSLVTAAVIDYTVPSSTVRTALGNFFKRLDNFTYVPANALNGLVKTQHSEGIFHAEINSPGAAFVSIDTVLLDSANSSNTAPTKPFKLLGGGLDPLGGKEDTMYLQYFNLLTSVHNSFGTQDLIPTRDYGAPSDTSLLLIRGGDSFMCYMSYMTASPRGSDLINDNARYTDGVRIWKAYIGYSRYNFNYRHEEAGNIPTFYHGKTDVRTLFSEPIFDYHPGDPTVPILTGGGLKSLVLTNQEINQIAYTEDYNRLNNFTVGVINHPSVLNQTDFPNTIIYSTVQNEESKEFSWSTFRAGDRFVTTKNRGDIINLQGFRNKQLIIHTEDSFFRTRTDIQVQADGENVFFQSANLFELPPEEPIPGYAGTQHKFGCVMTKVGYIFPDDQQGKMFLYDGENLQEISSNGMRNFFRDFMGVAEDNPFTSNGYSIGYDESMNRVIVTKKNGDTSWTISYNPSKRSWVSYHDYIPDHLFILANSSLYSLKDSNFHLNNPIPDTIQKGQYYGATINPMYIDVVFNPDAQTVKQFIAISWLTESYPVLVTDGQQDMEYNYDNTYTHITVRSADHCTGRIPLVQIGGIDSQYDSNLRNVSRNWYFDGLRDVAIAPGFVNGFYSNFSINPAKLNTNMDWHDQRKFTDKYVICRFEYDNVVNNRLILLENKIDFRNAR